MKLSQDKVAELQEILKAELIFFKEFCEGHNLQFYLAYGTCLGAVRHHGFIPWDDDVDILMPPKDYFRLLELWKPQTRIGRYTLCSTTDKYIDHHLSITIRDEETTYITTGDINSDTNHGIMIEIATYTYLPNSKIKKIIQDIRVALFLIFRAQRVPNSGSRNQKIIVKFLLSIFRSNRLRYTIWKHFEKYLFNEKEKDTKYVRVFGQFHTFSKYYPVHIFDTSVLMPFYETNMPVPQGYDEYLTILYKDYMTPPPVDSQVPVHDVVFVDCHKGYKNYKGIKYCI